MKVVIANDSKQTIGGGWTFLRNFKKYAERQGVQFVKEGGEGDIYFIAGATMIQRAQVQAAKAAGMKIVLRVDNAPKNSNNRNTGTSRLKDFAELCDGIVYQSNWARNYLAEWLGKDGPVILNGADTEIFNTEGSKQPKEGKHQYLYAQYNRDETKRWHEAWFYFQRAFRKRNGEAHLWIIGKFSPEHVEYNFDFFMGEKFRYVGVLESAVDFAEYLRSTDSLLIPYYNDACSNTLIEARLCGVPTIHHSNTGGNQQIMAADLKDLTADRMATDYINLFKSL